MKTSVVYIICLLLGNVNYSQFNVTANYNQIETIKPVKRYFVVYTSAGCGPCLLLKAQVLPKLTNAGWVVGKHIKFEDSSVELTKHKVDSVPTIIFFEDDVEVRRKVGYLNYDDTAKFLTTR